MWMPHFVLQTSLIPSLESELNVVISQIAKKNHWIKQWMCLQKKIHA